MGATLIENGIEKKLVSSKDCSVKELLENNKVNPETCIVSVNGSIAHPSYTIKDGDKVEVIKIIYGG